MKQNSLLKQYGNNVQRAGKALANIWFAFWAQGPRYFLGVVGSVVNRIADWLMEQKRAQYGLAVTRMLLGAVGFTMLIANFPTRYYTFGNASRWSGDLTDPVSDFPTLFPFSISHFFAQTNFGLTFLMVLLLGLSAALALGWRTRVVLPIYFVLWVGFIELQDMVGDQGDNIYRMTLFALLFADSGLRWSMDARRRRQASPEGSIAQRLFRGSPVLPASLTNLSHNLVLIVLTCQVCFVYVSGALYKAAGKPWQTGWAIYDTLGVAQFSTWPELAGLMTTWAPLVAALSVGTIIVQIAFPGALLHRWTRIPVMFAIFGFHAGIGLFMGLPWFSLSMVAIDSIFIRDVTWCRLVAWFKANMNSIDEADHEENLEGITTTDLVSAETNVDDSRSELVDSGSANGR